MIKARGEAKDGNLLLLLGLSGENITRLVAGEPVYIGASELVGMGFPALHIGIVYGKTEQAIMKQLHETP